MPRLGQEFNPERSFFKRLKNKTLDLQEKEYNCTLSCIRVKVEHIFAQVKTFKILSDRYRSKPNSVSGIVNLKNEFFLA
ncbi:hypothetical protein P618_201021 [Holospora obtusa F1]|uniref:DDE Tnp4 domain-containing protein n=1 Tax=Holospora obtusa F1 TaxID=1399147 RepID=W6TDX2_HOLOB|nr:hypothetical protein P618_201021 [Holospora obtusa F1]